MHRMRRDDHIETFSSRVVNSGALQESEVLSRHSAVHKAACAKLLYQFGCERRASAVNLSVVE